MSTAVETSNLTGTWNLDPVHSSVEFAVRYMGVSKFKSNFKEIEASLQAGESSRLEGKAKVESIDINVEQFKSHLLSDDFFAAEENPYLEFSSTSLNLDNGRLALEGEITIKGVTRPLTATGEFSGPFEDPYGNQRINLSLKATVDRTEFRLTWNNNLPTGEKALADEVEITAELQLVQGEEN